MNILIVDDERLVRITLESMLSDLCADDVIYQARNTDEMISKLKRMPFDLVFLDINMPKRQGLDAMESVKEEYPDTDWCILTGYSYFEYAKKALELGAKGYLLKPLDPEELGQFLDRIRSERFESRKINSSLFAEAVQKAIHLDDFTDIPSEMPAEYMLYTFFTDAHDDNYRRAVCRQLYLRLEEYMKQLREETREDFTLFFGNAGELCLIIKGAGNLRINAFLRSNMAEYRKTVIISGVSTRICKPAGLNETLKLQAALVSLRFYCKNMEVASTDKLDCDPFILKKNYFGVQLDKIIADYMAGDMEAFHHELKRMEKEHDNETELLTEEVKIHLEIILGYPIRADNINVLLKELWAAVTKKDFGSGIRQELILKICHYIRDNYMGDISLDRVGEVFQITPTYLSRFFREKTGQKYIDYVTEIRMQKAKELLEGGQYSVKEISNIVGYLSEKHFSRYFKKYYGISPSQIGCN